MFFHEGHAFLEKKPPAGLHHTEDRIGDAPNPPFPIQTRHFQSKTHQIIQSSNRRGRRQRRQPINRWRDHVILLPAIYLCFPLCMWCPTNCLRYASRALVMLRGHDAIAGTPPYRIQGWVVGRKHFPHNNHSKVHMNVGRSMRTRTNKKGNN